MNIRRIAGLALALFMVAALTQSAGPAGAEEAPNPYFVDESTLPFESLPGQPSEVSWGVLGDAGYRLEIPENWNGGLVMWAHGFRGEGLELRVDNPPIRSHILAQGYAWAASSYERNGYDPSTGVESTRALAEYVKANARGDVERIYIFGASMGGHVGALALEKDHRLYDGGLLICGVLGDYELFDYFLDFNLAAQQIALGWSQFPVEPAEWFGTTVPAIKGELEAVPGGWPFVLSEKGMGFKELVERQSGGERPNFDEAFAFWNGFPTATGFGNFLFDLGTGTGVLPNSDGRRVVDNTTTTYQLDDDRALSRAERDLNRDIERVAREKGSRGNEQITGDIRDRVLTLHNLGDLFVTFEMEIDYARDVRSMGRSNRLVQRAIRGVGHCDFTENELATAFDDLTHWVDTGARPAGDEVLRKGVVASDDYGCQFSDPDHTLHQFATPCA